MPKIVLIGAKTVANCFAHPYSVDWIERRFLRPHLPLIDLEHLAKY